jgi:hypothetical protein
MSGPPTISDDSIASSSPDTDAQRVDDDPKTTYSVKAPLQFVGFWVAVSLPFVHLPLLANGLDGLENALLFVGLLVLNLLALLVGHGHEQA